ncbi:MAG: 50S ribosomal protein L30 [Candidatus Methanofastidiosa archaeon]|jgi:large subunit ribosomal protein L30|nr:50S ribosomal protein L30 [Candidatus Methanofastidiosa archaeon]HOM95912.1 50S ribosomal protein L30 [Methanofastidiosum sp.]HPC81405.1 50S ribosomal protein L30 [Methanofastidiosum sp.]HRS26211.1 50S ribosomal protein L30 [Methanofastidiosum sp.]
MNRIAVIRVRGRVDVKKDVQDTLKMLNLTKTNHCVIIDDRDSFAGMLQKVKDYVTYGPIDSDTLSKLILKWGRLEGDVRVTEEYIKEKTGKSLESFCKDFLEFKSELSDIAIKKVFRLHPPQKGYEATKKPYTLGGTLGPRYSEINGLIQKMI